MTWWVRKSGRGTVRIALALPSGSGKVPAVLSRSIFAGHLWTIAPYVMRSVSPPKTTPSRHFSIPLVDPTGRHVRITGRFDELPGAKELVVFLHGMGGHAASPYMVRAAATARSQGLASLRVNMRGADRRGDDYYHAGLTADVSALFHHPDVQRYRAVYLYGFSLGGHIALASAVRETLPKLRAVAAVCAPIALEPAARALDERVRAVYRKKLLSDLKQVYREVAARRSVPVRPDDADRIDSIVEWDTRIIAPRWGFEDARDYYRKMSVGPELDRLSVPTLVLQAKRDPMVLARSARPLLDRAPAVTTKWMDHGGHIAFPKDLDLGLPHPPGLEEQSLGWLQAANRSSSGMNPGEARLNPEIVEGPQRESVPPESLL